MIKKLPLIRLFFSKQGQNILAIKTPRLFYNNTKWLCFAFFVFQLGYCQMCSVVKSGNFSNVTTNSTDWGLPSTTSTTGWGLYNGQAYIDRDGGGPISLKQNVTGLIGGTLTVSFKVRGQNADRLNCNTNATLDVKIGGTTYMTIVNQSFNVTSSGNAVITTSNISMPVSGTSYVQSGFPIVVGRDSATKPGTTEAALTQGTITLTIPWSPANAAATIADLEFVTTASNTLVVGSGNCSTTTGGDDWFIDDVSIITSNPAIYNVSGANVCNGTNTTISLSNSQFGVNYELLRGTTVVGSAIAGTGSVISFPIQNTAGVYTVRAKVGTTTCTSTMNGNVTIHPNPTLTNAAQPAAQPAVCSGSGAVINLTGLLPGTASTINYTINGVAQTAVTGVVSDASGAGNFTTPVLTFANNGQILQITGVTNTSATPNCTTSFARNVTLAVNRTPTLTGASQPVTACAGSGAVINLTGLLPGSTSTISYSINGVAQLAVTGIVANGSGEASFSTSVLTTVNNGQTLQITGVTTTSASPNCTTSFTQNVALSVSASPTISTAATTAVVTAICHSASAQTTSMAYTATTLSPTSYSIDWATLTDQLSTAFTFAAGGGTVTGIIVPAGTPSGTYTGTMTVISASGCTGTKAITLTINPVLTASVSISTSPAGSVCAGTTVTFTATPTNPGTTPVYQWKLNGANVGTNSTTYTNATLLLNNDVVTCEMTSNATPCLAGSPAVSNAITVASSGPVTTGVTICAGDSGSLISSYNCTNSSTQIASGSGGTANETTYGGSGNTNISINFPALPVGATVTNISTIITYTSTTPSYTNELRIQATPPAALGAIQTDLQAASTASSAGTITNQIFGTWGTASPVGTWTFRFRETFNDNDVNPDANISNISIVVTYTVAGSINWYTASSGGTLLGSGSSFNPVGVAGSGLSNTNTAGTTIFYAACSSSPGCRTPTAFVINARPIPLTVGTITHISCTTNTGSVVLDNLPGGSWTITSSPSTVTTTGSGTSTTISGLAAGSYTFTVTNASNCPSSASAPVTILDYTSTSWNGSAWSNGGPDATKNVIITSVTPSSPFTVDLEACALTINSGVVATVPSGITLTITNTVTVNGQLIFENNASLVQTANVLNFGNIIYKRISQPMKNFDYTYWSSPVSGQTTVGLSPNTLSDKYFRYEPAKGWVLNRGTMEPGIGYIIRTPKAGTWPAPYAETVVFPYSQPVQFTGVPNNGNITSSQAMTAGNFYLIGNPYPSALKAEDFLYGNANNHTVLNGTIYLWTHNTAIQQSGPKLIYVSDDYASFNATGGTGTTNHSANTGMNNTIPSGYIAAGQSFFASAKANGSVEFDNSMRAGGANNAQFFKPGKTSKSAGLEKHRLWLTMTNSGGAYKQTLIGYVQGATNSYDGDYDGLSFDGNSYIDFYSVNADDNLTIQGRALPFTDTDLVPLGYRSTIAGDFTIAIDKTDGNLSTQRVYLEDRQTGTINELTANNYTFTTKAGTFKDRFVLRYSNKTLETGDFETTDDAVWVVIQNKTITINSTVENIDKVFIYDISGKQLYSKDDVKDLQLIMQNLPFAQQVLLVKVVLDNGYQTTKKVIFK